MNNPMRGFLCTIFIVAISQTTWSSDVILDAVNGEKNASAAATTGTPAPGGKGPGMGRAYRQNTPGPGRGGPDYRGGQLVAPEPVAAPPGNDSKDQQQANAGPGAVNIRGYPYPDIYWAGGRRGYGRGYGYGYPGYRGNGGYRYPRHRQYGTPPLYPAPAIPADIPASQN